MTNARDFLTAIAFVHAVTGPAALRPMLPLLGVETAQAALAYVWQASAGLYATFATAQDIAGLDLDTNAGAAELTERAIACGDEHAIKFTAACLAEHALNPQPVFLAAADRAIGLLCSGA
jgi:hypothetical protein